MKKVIKRKKSKPVVTELDGYTEITYHGSVRVSAGFCSVDHSFGMTMKVNGTKADADRKAEHLVNEVEGVLDALLEGRAEDRVLELNEIRRRIEKA